LPVPLADDARTFHKIGQHARNADANVLSCHSFGIPLAALKIAFILSGTASVVDLKLLRICSEFA
jgi:hypothetical protein